MSLTLITNDVIALSTIGSERLTQGAPKWSSTGDLSATTFYGDGSKLTGIVSGGSGTDTGVRSLTSKYENTYSTVNSNSATNWNYQGTDLKGLSANWQNTYTTVNSNSATNWNYQGTDLKGLSANWQNTYNTVQSNSATNWQNVATNLSQVTGTNTLQLNSSTGTSITLLAATSAMAGLMTAQDRRTLTTLTTAYSAYGPDIFYIMGATVEYVAVAGGGAGGSTNSNGEGAGGGGAGGCLSGTFVAVNNDQITIIIGAGGAPALIPNTFSQSGSNSQIVTKTVTVVGGGYGGSTWNGIGAIGGSGGCGGGAGYDSFTNGGAGTTGQGFDGGDNFAGGGGGKRAAGEPGTMFSGSGGAGITWNTVEVAGGGGGGGKPAGVSLGGLGGGGNGAVLDDPGYSVAENGSTNTGGGGGGGAYQTTYPFLSAGGNGGSGVVIFKYPTALSISTAPLSSGIFSQSGGYKYTNIVSSCIATFTTL